MPQIRQYTRQRMPRELINVQANARSFGGDVSGMMAQAQSSREMARSLEDLGQTIEKIKVKREESDYYKKISDFELENMQRKQELQNADYEDLETISDSYVEDLEQRAAQLEIPASMRNRYQRDLANMRRNFAQSGMKEQARRVGVQAKNNFNNTLTNVTNMVTLDPSREPEALNLIESQVEAMPNLAEVDKQSVLNGAKDGLRKASANSQALKNPAQFIAQAKDGQFNDVPDLDVIMRRAERELESQIQKRQARLQSQLSSKISDGIAEAQTTGSSEQLPSEKQIREAYDSEKANQILSEISNAKNFGEKYISISTASPQEINEILSGSVPEGEGFAREQKERQMLVSAVEQRNKVINSDPVNYVGKTFPEVEEAYAALEEDNSPAALRYAVNLSLEKQSQLGVPDYKQRVLGQGQASTFVNQMKDMNSTQRLEQVETLKQSYGSYWPTVHAELEDAGLPGDLSVQTRMNSLRQARPKQLLAEAQEIEDINKLFVKEDVTQIEDNVQQELSDFYGTVTAQIGNASTIDKYRNATENLAKMYVMRDKMSASDAAKKAAADIVNDHYNIVGLARVPAQYDDSAVQAGMEEFLALIGEADYIDPAVTGSLSEGMTDEMIKSEYMKELTLGGRWITNAAEDGAYLVDPIGRPVYSNKGEIVEFPFDYFELVGKDPNAGNNPTQRAIDKGDLYVGGNVIMRRNNE